MAEPGDGVQAWNSGWDGHERAQRRRFASLSLDEKLRWLEEAQQLARQLADAKRTAEHPPRADQDTRERPRGSEA
jgi:hypothetical protein